MDGPRPDRSRQPVLLDIAGAVRQRRGGHDHAMRLSAHRRDERDRRVDVVPVHPDIHVAAVLPLDAEPIDEPRRSWLPDAFQHVAPALERHAAAPLEASADRLDPAAACRCPAPPPRCRAGRPDASPIPPAASEDGPRPSPTPAPPRPALPPVRWFPFPGCRSCRGHGRGHGPAAAPSAGRLPPPRSPSRRSGGCPSLPPAARGRRGRPHRPAPSPPRRRRQDPRPAASGHGRGCSGRLRRPAASAAVRRFPARSDGRRRRCPPRRRHGAPRRRRSGSAEPHPRRPAPPGS